ncbi:MAG: AI-2E family transporter [Prolixibacteraceae bacterium]
MIKMKETTRNILLTVGILFLLFLVWYFRSIVGYILIAAVLSLTGRPVVRFLQKLKIGGFRFSKSLSALITLVLMWIIFAGSFSFMIPLLINEFNQLSAIDPQLVMSEIEGPLRQLMTLVGSRSATAEDWTLFDIIKAQFGENFNFSQLSNIFGIVAGALGDFFIALFSISFITFFFLQKETMFKEGVLLFVPTAYEEQVLRILNSVYLLLKRYFIGLVLEIFMVGLLTTAGLTIVGLGFNHAIVIGVFCGLFNIIPYLGPWIGAVIGLLIGVAINVHVNFMTNTLPLLGFMTIVFVLVQMVDNLLFQPLIYSSSIKAHPLEIFLVILVAGNLAGITGMILAIPVYTVLRVIAGEFLEDLKVVRKLTKNMQ